MQLAESTVRAIDFRYLERWAAGRKKPALRQMRVDEIYLGKSDKFITVVSNLESGEPLWFGRERKKDTLDEFFRRQLSASHANKAIDEVRRAEFVRQGGWRKQLVKGKRWLLLTRWVNLTEDKQQDLNQLFKLNRRIMKAYLLKESLQDLWLQPNEIRARDYLTNWIRQLRWQRLPAFEKLAYFLIDHFDGILNYYRVPVRFGVVEAINGNLRILLRRGRGYKNLRYLLLKAQHIAETKTEFVAFKVAA